MSLKLPSKFVKLCIFSACFLSHFIISAASFHSFGGSSSLETSGNPADTVIRIMPLGNSITFGNSVDLELSKDEAFMKSYRAKLWQLLNDKGYPVDFVGSEKTGQSVTPAFDPDNAGFSGINKGHLLDILKTGVNTRNGKTVSQGYYLDAHRPSVILLHIGTNNPTASVTEIEEILNEVDAYEARSGIPTLVVLARIIKRIKDPSNDFDVSPQRVTDYNIALATLAQQRSNSGDNLIFVDMETGADLNYSTAVGGDMADIFHPRESGFNKMAQVWYAALKDFFGEAPSPPSGLVAAGLSPTSIELSWNDNSSDESHFYVERSTSDQGPFAVVATLDTNVKTFVDEGLTANKSYYYRVRGSSPVLYSDYSNVVNFTPTAHLIPAPSELKAELTSDKKVQLTWKDNSDNETNFVLESSTSEAGAFSILATLPANTTSYTHSPQGTLQTMYFKVKATNGNTSSAYSQVASTLVTSTDKEIFIKGVSIYPNPFNGMFQLEIDNDLYGNFSVQIISLIGGQLVDLNFEKKARSFTKSFNLSGFNEGIYLLHITHDQYKTVRRISLKQ